MRLEIVPDRLRRQRLERALTQDELAKRSGLDPSSVSYLERGARRARVSTIRALAKALGCAPLDIARIENGDGRAGSHLA